MNVTCQLLPLNFVLITHDSSFSMNRSIAFNEDLKSNPPTNNLKQKHEIFSKTVRTKANFHTDFISQNISTRYFSLKIH